MRTLWTTALLLTNVAAAHADGGAVRFSDRCGAYRVTVFTEPTPWRAGPVDVSVLVQDPTTGEPRTDLRVAIRVAGTRHPATHEAATNKLLYSAEFDLPAAGTWPIEVVIDGPAGSATATLEVEAAEALPAGGEMLWWIVWPVVPVVFFAWHQVRVATGRGEGTRDAVEKP